MSMRSVTFEFVSVLEAEFGAGLRACLLAAWPSAGLCSCAVSVATK
ncbi:hypothetical protein [Adonisia turfae]|nr:hypothetical protein [Adonisia turfae]